MRRLEDFGRNRDQPLTGVRRPYFAGLHSNQSGPYLGVPVTARVDNHSADNQRQAWLSAAAAVLRRAGRLTDEDADEQAFEVLSSSTIEGLPIEPLGAPLAPPKVGAAARDCDPGRPPFLRGAGPAVEPGWDIRALLADPDPESAARSASADLEGGVTSLWLRVGGGGTALKDTAAVLAGVHLDLAPVVLQSSLDIGPMDGPAQLAGVLDQRGLRAHPECNLGTDPVGRFLRSGERSSDDELDVTKTLQRSALLANDLGIRAFVVDATVAHERGAGEAAELGYSVAVGVHYLRAVSELDLDLAALLRLFEFRYAATDDQFVTIAKFRAARLLWDRVAQLSGAPIDREPQSQHAVTSEPMMTRYDSWTNLLRTTVAAFAAGVGGAQTLTVLPFDSALGTPNALGRRLARNISALLIRESHVAVVQDPAGGAGGLEALTWELAEAGWEQFQRIEADGSVIRAATDGSLRRRWDRTKRRRTDSTGSRRQLITGINEFPLLGEVLPIRGISSAPAEEDVSAYRWANEYETMRDQSAPRSVFLAPIGQLTAHSARVSFATNAFAAGGLPVTHPGLGLTRSGIDVAGAVVSYRAAGSPPVVCLTGSDADYAQAGAELARSLRKAGARRIIVVGRPDAEFTELIDDRLAVGDDLVQFLERTRHALAADNDGSRDSGDKADSDGNDVRNEAPGQGESA